MMEKTIAQKIEALSDLQAIDSQLDELKKVRGALPEEVRDLEDEIAGYETRIQKYKQEIAGLEQEITNNKLAIKDSEKLIKKYEEQQLNVRNNREYDAITKETELQQLEIQIAEKRISDGRAKIEIKLQDIQATEQIMKERSKDLESKRSELQLIVSESQEEENKLLKKREKAIANVEDRLYKSYNKIRDNAKNGLAVVPVKRGACGGCFNIVPPQRQADVREKKKLIVCEHCGRIFSDVDDSMEEDKKAKKVRKQ
jgi:uncharacterized protein